MYARVPVIAVDSGGPRESIVDGVTGYLVEGVEKFAECVERVVGMGSEERQGMGSEGRKRVEEMFGLDAFTKGLAGILEGRGGDEGMWTFYWSLGFVGLVLAVCFVL